MDRYIKNRPYFTNIRAENIIPRPQRTIEDDGFHNLTIHEDVLRNAHEDDPFYENIGHEVEYVLSQGETENNGIYFTETHAVIPQGGAEINDVYFTETNEGLERNAREDDIFDDYSLHSVEYVMS